MKRVCVGLFFLLFFFVEAASENYLDSKARIWINAIIAIVLVVVFVRATDLREKIQPETKGMLIISIGVVFTVLFYILGTSFWLSMMGSSKMAEQIIMNLVVLLLYVAPALIYLKTMGALLIVIGLIKFFATIESPSFEEEPL